MRAQDLLVAPTKAPGRLRRLGWLCLVAGLLGAASGVWLAVTSPQVPDDRYSYPLDVAQFSAIQVFFFVQHLGLLAGLLGLWHSGAIGRARYARWGLVAAGCGMVLLAVTELVAITAADARYPGPGTGVLDALYGTASFAIGVGVLLAGVAVVKARLWGGWPRWLPLAIGGYVFVPMTPALSGPFVVARLAIAAWMLLFAALGAALLRDRTA